MPRVYDRPREEAAAKFEHSGIEMQTVSGRYSAAFSRQRVSPQQSSTREFNAVVLGGWSYRNSLQQTQR